MIKKSWTALIVVSLCMLIYNISPVNAKASDDVDVMQEESVRLSQEQLGEIFTVFSEINTALEKDIKEYQGFIDDYSNDRLTPSEMNTNVTKLNESIKNTRSKTYSLNFTGKYEDDKIQLLRTCDMLHQSLKDMKISISLRNTGYYSKAKQELQDAEHFKSLAWKHINEDLYYDGYIPAK
ncbi:hypothetical protein [Pelosinus propionicus]|uniref:Uncharacterized protein n=1 Tax=Pelosinus propionicus DSM 13327 TaxID=1123291 RepID=A0A1I4HJ61_9FIRM|nr:hypothetical protein [Pelosinus propionicus]SFL42232.1 hypothetical protein SAMN04490355_100433 [Pelosinus propionicus DSM 13327]